MNSKRKADLQRKLTLAPVPRPPAGLADRIKNDIPDHLRPDADRRRVSRALSFNLRVAASLLVLLSSVVAAVYLLEPEDQMQQMAASTRQGPTQVFAERDAAAATAAATDEVRVEITQEAPPPAVQVAELSTAYTAVPTAAAAAPVRLRAAENAESESGTEGRAEGVVGGAAAGRVAASESYTVAETAAPVPPPAAPVPTAPAATEAASAPAPERVAMAPQAQAREERKTLSAGLIREAQAADLDLGPRNNVFGISVDPAVFHNIKETLENNQRPSAQVVNLEAIVNYFAGAPSKPPRKGVKLEVEGSPSPVGGIGQRGFFRFSIDTPVTTSTLPVASDAKLAITFNSKVVEQATAIGDATASTQESALLNNLSLTGLYELTLKATRRPTDRVATVRLTYRDVADGKTRTIERAVYARDFTKMWTRASRRHRLASLGAVWGQSLKVSSPAPEVARRAEELATQNPADERAQELATAAEASSKLVNSSGF